MCALHCQRLHVPVPRRRVNVPSHRPGRPQGAADCCARSPYLGMQLEAAAHHGHAHVHVLHTQRRVVVTVLYTSMQAAVFLPGSDMCACSVPLSREWDNGARRSGKQHAAPPWRPCAQVASLVMCETHLCDDVRPWHAAEACWSGRCGSCSTPCLQYCMPHGTPRIAVCCCVGRAGFHFRPRAHWTLVVHMHGN